MPQFAANLSMMFNEVAFPQRFAAAAAAGFKAVEFLFPYAHSPQEVAGWLKENQLQNVLFNLPPGDWDAGERGIAALPGREEEFRAGVAKGITYALAMGTPRVHMMAGLIPAGAEVSVYREVYLRNMRYAAQEVGKHGLKLLLEPINGRDMPGYFLNSQAQAHALREEGGEANVLVQMDFYHAQIVEGDLATTFKKHFDGIGHVQIASVPSRNEPDDGEVNYAYLFRLLDEMGYEGWIGCEYRPRGRTEDGLGWLKAAETASIPASTRTSGA
ncbi:hydroxypyruvate isomerase family protein [Herbaspirillum sp. RTI4]|uniref:2-oxo-tetronate isomerase n=1 Tax=Herbaspirillum sp. RTI4 TaxID=3048640 RepID=UPI002AB3F194|nr:2-oxo-tetronate isomerase [Herbaspirillum sp. RTI4]MDY7577177.1 hydroxypyruvate isomerase family protein [Herbaspirillum sp. RTI4]MEA9980467.1 hydroxypyruvate isomerase family protein [Herbaspirillum sp. RTI4]